MGILRIKDPSTCRADQALLSGAFYLPQTSQGPLRTVSTFAPPTPVTFDSLVSPASRRIGGDWRNRTSTVVRAVGVDDQSTLSPASGDQPYAP